MYGLPLSTERKQQLPKKAIYTKFDLKSSQRESFDADSARMDIVSVVYPATDQAHSAEYCLCPAIRWADAVHCFSYKTDYVRMAIHK